MTEFAEYVEHEDDVPWFAAPKPWRWHKHRAQTKAFLDGTYDERCACGAFGPAPWIMLRPDKPRVWTFRR